MTFEHLVYGAVVRSGPTKWLKSGAAVPCVDQFGKTRLLLVDPQYWGKSRPTVREYQVRSRFFSRLNHLLREPEYQRTKLPAA